MEEILVPPLTTGKTDEGTKGTHFNPMKKILAPLQTEGHAPHKMIAPLNLVVIQDHTYVLPLNWVEV